MTKIVLFFFLSSLCFSQQKVDTLKLEKYRITDLDKEIEETSGLTMWGDKLYTFNDSGGKPEIYQVKKKSGKVKNTYKIDAQNEDWEAITHDDKNFYIGDFGNNLGNRKDLSIYKIPFNEDTKELKATKITFYYPEQESFEKENTHHNFDCEAMMYDQGKLHLFTKQWVNRSVSHYTIDPNIQNQAAQKVEEFFCNYVVTDASFYQNKLYLVGYTKQAQVYLSIYEKDQRGRFFTKNAKKYFLGLSVQLCQIEGVTATNEGLYISGEKFKTKISKAKQGLYFVPYSVLNK